MLKGSGAMRQCIDIARHIGAWDVKPEPKEIPEAWLRFGANSGPTSRKGRRAMETICQAFRNGLITAEKACEMARAAMELRDPPPNPSKAKRIQRLEGQLAGARGLKALTPQQRAEIERRNGPRATGPAEYRLDRADRRADEIARRKEYEARLEAAANLRR